MSIYKLSDKQYLCLLKIKNPLITVLPKDLNKNTLNSLINRKLVEFDSYGLLQLTELGLELIKTSFWVLRYYLFDNKVKYDLHINVFLQDVLLFNGSISDFLDKFSKNYECNFKGINCGDTFRFNSHLGTLYVKAT